MLQIQVVIEPFNSLIRLSRYTNCNVERRSKNPKNMTHHRPYDRFSFGFLFAVAKVELDSSALRHSKWHL